MGRDASREGAAARTVLWVIDDQVSCFELVRRSLPQPDHYELLHYLDGLEALDTIATLLSSENGLGLLPDIIFMDYFMAQIDGGAVTVELRRLFKAAGRRGPFILGHSSAFNASQRIQALGGDVAIHKNVRSARSSDIVALFPDLVSIDRFQGRAAEPAARRSVDQ